MISTSVVSAPSKLTNVTFISSAGGSISLNINRPKNLGGVPLSAITYVADVCLSDNTGNCEKSPLQNVIVTIDSIYTTIQSTPIQKILRDFPKLRW